MNVESQDPNDRPLSMMSASPDFGIDFSQQSADDLKEALKLLAKRHSETIVERDGALDERDDALDKLAMIEEGIAQLQTGSIDVDTGLGAAFARFSDFSSSPICGEDAQVEIDDLKMSLRESEEALHDCRATLERERQYAELISQDDDMQQQQADLQQNILRSQNLETELNKVRSEASQLEMELADSVDTITDLESRLVKSRELVVQETHARERQFAELQRVQSRSAELESKIIKLQSKHSESDNEITTLKTHITTTELGFEKEIAGLRHKLSAATAAIKDREKTVKKAEEELVILRAHANPTNSLEDMLSPVKLNHASLGAELDSSVVVETPKEVLAYDRAISMLQSEFPYSANNEDLVKSVASVIDELRTKKALLSKVERTTEALEKRVCDTDAKLQERTTLAVKSINMLERSVLRLAKHAGEDDNVAIENGDTEDLNVRAESIIDQLGKQITKVDFRYETLATETKLTAEKLTTESAQLKKQLKEEKKKTLPTFLCKYLGHTEVDTSRPDQRQLWQAIDVIRRGNDNNAKMIELSTCQHRVHAGQPWLATMYGRAQDGTAVISKPYLTLCSVGQVETYVIFVCYTRTGGTMDRRFWVHSVACTDTTAAESLSQFLIGQCEVAHQYRKSTKAAEVLQKALTKKTQKETKGEGNDKGEKSDANKVSMRPKAKSSPARRQKRMSTITSAAAVTAGVMSLALNDHLSPLSEETRSELKSSSSTLSTIPSPKSSSLTSPKSSRSSSRKPAKSTLSGSSMRKPKTKIKTKTENETEKSKPKAPAMMGFGSWIKKTTC
eukprot:m.211814 g.211814  ORF g.211814 m.211814 type:complete len:794 (-) comp33110_c3_seq4:266-2647(-)